MEISEYGSEFDWESTSFFLSTDSGPHLIKSSEAKRFRSGRDALKAVARMYNKTHRRVLLPALCCESMVSPFTVNGYQSVFYRMNEDCTVNVEDLKKKMTNDSIVVYMAYFGIKPVDDFVLQDLKNVFASSKFIEDRTHNALHSVSTHKFEPDATVISIRKWLSVADGGLLFSKDAVDEQYGCDLKFSELRKTAMTKKSEYLKSGDEKIKVQFRELLNKASDLLDENAVAYAMTADSQELLSKVDYKKILLQRQKNAKVLFDSLEPLTKNGRLKFITANPENSTLYFPIILSKRDDVQKSLATDGVFCPVIWPTPEQAKGVCCNSEFIANNMLAIPCDQRYGEQDMLYIAKLIKERLNDER